MSHQLLHYLDIIAALGQQGAVGVPEGMPANLFGDSIREMDGETVFFLPRATHPAFHDKTVEYIESTGARLVLREVLSIAHALEIVAHNLGIALLPRSASRLAHGGVAFRPISDKLFWMETVLFLRKGVQDDRIQSLRDALLAQFGDHNR